MTKPEEHKKGFSSRMTEKKERREGEKEILAWENNKMEDDKDVFLDILIFMYISVLPLARSLHPRPYTYSVSELWEGQIVI
jgi:hypothetical protein